MLRTNGNKALILLLLMSLLILGGGCGGDGSDSVNGASIDYQETVISEDERQAAASLGPLTRVDAIMNFGTATNYMLHIDVYEFGQASERTVYITGSVNQSHRITSGPVNKLYDINGNHEGYMYTYKTNINMRNPGGTHSGKIYNFRAESKNAFSPYNILGCDAGGYSFE